MDYTVSVADGARLNALYKANAAYNASHPAEALDPTQFLQKMIDAQVDNLVKAYLVTSVTRLAFLQRFTAQERVAIRAAAAQNPGIEDYLQMLNVADEVSLTSATTVGGVQSLEAAGLIASGRAAEILAL
jgi:DNA-binding MarR family transcriptional regulator